MAGIDNTEMLNPVPGEASTALVAEITRKQKLVQFTAGFFVGVIVTDLCIILFALALRVIL